MAPQIPRPAMPLPRLYRLNRPDGVYRILCTFERYPGEMLDMSADALGWLSTCWSPSCLWRSSGRSLIGFGARCRDILGAPPALVRVKGLEPPLPYGKQILSLPRLPFRHTRTRRNLHSPAGRDKGWRAAERFAAS